MDSIDHGVSRTYHVFIPRHIQILVKYQLDITIFSKAINVFNIHVVQRVFKAFQVLMIL